MLYDMLGPDKNISLDWIKTYEIGSCFLIFEGFRNAETTILIVVSAHNCFFGTYLLFQHITAFKPPQQMKTLFASTVALIENHREGIFAAEFLLGGFCPFLLDL